MLQGFIVDGHDNESYAFREQPKAKARSRGRRIQQSVAPDMSADPRTSPRRCPKCGELLDKWTEPLFGLTITKRRLDFSATYDGIDIASARFRQVYTKNRLTGLVLTALPDDSEFFHVQAKQVVRFDAGRVGTEFHNQCSRCGRYESVIGADPVLLMAGNRIPSRGFVRTDLEFASSDEKAPLLLCGVKAAEILKAARLKGLSLEAIEDEPPVSDDAYNG
jgi:hypothetical protein